MVGRIRSVDRYRPAWQVGAGKPQPGPPGTRCRAGSSSRGRSDSDRSRPGFHLVDGPSRWRNSMGSFARLGVSIPPGGWREGGPRGQEGRAQPRLREVHCRRTRTPVSPSSWPATGTRQRHDRPAGRHSCTDRAGDVHPGRPAAPGTRHRARVCSVAVDMCEGGFGMPALGAGRTRNRRRGMPTVQASRSELAPRPVPAVTTRAWHMARSAS